MYIDVPDPKDTYGTVLIRLAVCPLAVSRGDHSFFMRSLFQ